MASIAGILSLIFLIALVGLIVGLFRPSLALFWSSSESRTRKRVLAVYGGALLASLVLPIYLTGPSGRNEQRATPTPLPRIGTTVASRNWEYTVTKVERTKTFKWTAFGNTTNAKGVWLIVCLTLKNIGSESLHIGPWDFGLIDATGKQYSPYVGFDYFWFLETMKSEPIGAMELFPPGVAFNTILLFDINPEARGLKLELKQPSKVIELAE